MLAGYDSHLLWYMQIFKGLIHKAKAATDALAWNLLYVRKSLKDYYLCPKSPLLPTSPWGSRALPTPPGIWGWGRSPPHCACPSAAGYVLVPWAAAQRCSPSTLLSVEANSCPPQPLLAIKTWTSSPWTALMIFLCWLETRNSNSMNNGE